MKTVGELEKYFVINDFEDGWGMDDVVCEEQLMDYSIEVLYIPSEKISELLMDENNNLEISLEDLEISDVSEDWYVNLSRMSKSSS